MSKDFKPWTKDEIRQLLADNYATCREVADAEFGFTMYQVMGIKGNMVMRSKTKTPGLKTTNKGEYRLRFGVREKPFATSKNFPKVSFYIKRPRGPFSGKNNCLFCGNPALYVADLGISERRCCSNPDCMEQAAEQVWRNNCQVAELEGFPGNEHGVHEYLCSRANEIKNKRNSAQILH